MPTNAYLYSAVRTPRGKGRSTGALHNVPPVALVTTLLHTLHQRHGLGEQPIDDLILGCVTPVDE